MQSALQNLNFRTVPTNCQKSCLKGTSDNNLSESAVVFQKSMPVQSMTGMSFPYTVYFRSTKSESFRPCNLLTK